MADERVFSASKDTVVHYVDQEGKSHRVDFQDGNYSVKVTDNNNERLQALESSPLVKEVKEAPKEESKPKGKG